MIQDSSLRGKSFLRKINHDHDLKIILTLILFTLFTGGLVYYKRIAFPTNNDYSLHVLFTQQLLEKQFSNIPLFNLAHPGLQITLILIHFLSLGKLGLYASLMIVQTLAQIATALILYFWFGTGEGRNWNWKRAFWAFTLTIVAPIPLMAAWDNLFYYGYIGLASYHNPTTHLLRPFALLIFIFAVRIFDEPDCSVRTRRILAVLLIASALIKPSYVICLLPALAVLAFFFLIEKKPFDMKTLILGGFIPTIGVLFFQWMLTYQLQTGENAPILFQPFAVESAFSSYLLPKLLLSMAFPLMLLLAKWRELFQRNDAILAWVSFIIGVAQLYLLAEGGDRFYHGNFRWGAQITLFILFAFSARFFLRERSWKNKKQSMEYWVIVVFYGAHIVAGIIYYIRSFLLATYS